MLAIVILVTVYALSHDERGAFRLMELAIYSAALTDAQWAQVMAHARAAHGVR